MKQFIQAATSIFCKKNTGKFNYFRFASSVFFYCLLVFLSVSWVSPPDSACVPVEHEMACMPIEKNLQLERGAIPFSTVTANFQISTNPCTVFSCIRFTNLSQNAVSYHWDFGDGITSTETNPEHAFLQSGVYSVTLTAFGPEQEQASFIGIVDIVDL
ncbi:MAG: PKD domain-containing protein [Bacteroidota bacterium]